MDSRTASKETLVRNDWTREEVRDLYHGPLLSLVFRAASVHRLFHDPEEVQRCTLLSIKTGGCPEDCSYCPQSARYKTGVENEKLLDLSEVMEAATRAREAGSSRFCMGAAWRSPRDESEFESVLEMVSKVAETGMEVCCTLGMLSSSQAKRLKEAGLTAYNHNLDTGEGFYDKIISTRTYGERLATIENVRNAGISVCCGGIVGLGESDDDRIDLLHTLATMNEHPESVPVNALVAVEGTPLGESEIVSPLILVRTIAAARILMPAARVRLSAGRINLSAAEQALCFLAGANSIFAGERLLTTLNNPECEDSSMLEALGLRSPSLC